MFKDEYNKRHFELLSSFWSKLGSTFPFLSFNKKWQFKLIAPTNPSELIRIIVRHVDFPDNPCSVLLTSVEDFIFWEVYPSYKLKDTGQLTYKRCDVNNTKELKTLISKALKNTTNNFGRNRVGIKRPRKHLNDRAI